MTMNEPRTLDPQPQPEADDDARYVLTALGAYTLGGRLSIGLIHDMVAGIGRLDATALEPVEYFPQWQAWDRIR